MASRTRMIARRTFAVSQAAGGDIVFMGMSLPTDTVMHRIRARVSVVDDAKEAVASIRLYAVEGWIIPVVDPDANVNFDTLFDQFVPKDTDAGIMDLDTVATDASTFWEPGEVDLTSLIPVGMKPKRIFQRTRMLTASDGAMSVFADTETPFTALWIPGESFDIDVRKPFRVDRPSVVLFALANPAGDDTTATQENAAAENIWGQIRYVQHTLERAMMHVLGMTEAGAETPWVEAITALQQHLEPDVWENVGGFIGNGSLFVAGRGLFDHSVTGELGKQTVTTGR